ncbi:glycoside hydrolase superfamily [Endogone sp. FLAS-F59071]|nr:glycoside hydrolase superfamily [Endogone sp. FLAS-F59071]|eukprot:RUS16342.1 glycoside hydrolase superfamily [Endogone sp. FLAS-F59071]
MTCQRRPGSLGFERQDAKTYAEWGVDYLKAGSLRWDAWLQPLEDIVMGEEDPWIWGPEIANSWRTTDVFNKLSDVDGACSPCSMLDILDRQVVITQYAGPGGFNDPDMLEIGNGGMTYEEYKSHFTFWAALKSPLIIGCDVRDMTKEIFDILTAPEVIAVNQDPLGKSIRLVKRNHNIGTELWIGPLSSGDLVAVLFNRNTTPQSLTVSWSSDLFIPDTTKLLIRDLWERTDLGFYDYQYTVNDIPGHGVVMLKFSERL